jgi:hypothetical protein
MKSTSTLNKKSSNIRTALMLLVLMLTAILQSSSQTLIPYSGSNVVSCGTNTSLCTHAGCGSTYSSNANGYTVLNASSTSIINISGTYVTESGNDLIKIYAGTGTGGSLLQTYSGSGSINYTGAIGQTLTVQFTSNGSVNKSGLSATVTYSGTCLGNYGAGCAHTLELRDTYGDGWNGGSVNLYVGGSLIGTYTLASGYGPASYSFNAIPGQSIQVTYTAGSWAYENYFTVKSGAGAALVSNWYPSSSGTWNGTASCSSNAPANDNCSSPVAIGTSLPYTSAIVSNANATDDVPVSACDGPYKNIWWTVTGVCGTMTANTCTGNTNFDSEIAVFTGSCGNFTQIACNDDGCGLQSTVTWNSTAGTVYYISVGSYSSSSATGNIQLNVTAVQNTLSTAPTSVTGTSTLCSGLSTTLTAAGGIDGSGASLEWFSGSCGGSLVGTGSSITVSPAVTTTYYVRRSGTCNTTACASATVTVNAPSASQPSAISSGDYVWSGNVSNDWATAANWLSYNGTSFSVAAAIPSSSSNVYLRAYSSCAATAPSINAGSTASVKDLIIESGRSLSMGAGSTLNVSGNWSNSGTFSSGTGTVVLAGSQTQSVKSGGSSFYNLTINNNTAGNNDIILSDPAIISNTGTFINGIVNYTGTGTLSFTNGATCPSGGSANSFVNTAGTSYVSKSGTNAFIFPVGEIKSGDVPVWAPVGIEAPLMNSTITADYNFNSSPNNWEPSDMCDLSQLNHTSGVEYWNLTTSASTPAVTLYWKDGARSGITNTDDLVVAHWESCGATNKWVSKGGSVSGTASSGSVSSTAAFSSYSPVTFGTRSGLNPLPVSLLTFSVKCSSQGVIASWTTASEVNNDYFTLEASSDLQSWETVAVVDGAGNSNTLLSYTAGNTTNSNRYYRLKQTDFDGQFTYSSVESVNCGMTTELSLSVYPNPAGDYINFDLGNSVVMNATLRIWNSMGELVFSKASVSQGDVLQIDLTSMKPGVYQYSVTDDSGIVKGQFVKLD